MTASMHIALLQFYSSRPTADYDQIATHLRAQGHTVWVATPSADGDLVWYSGDSVVAVLPGPAALTPTRSFPGSQRIGELRFMLAVRRFLRQHRPQIVQVNPASIHWVWLLPLLMPAFMAFVLDWRQIGERSVGGWLDSLKWRWFSWRRYIYSRFIYDRAAFLHWAGAQRVLGEGWKRWANVIPMGVDDQFLTTSPRDKNASPQGGTVRFLYLGSIARVRQLEFLLAAAKELSQTHTDFEIIFLGQDATQGYYAQQAQALGLTKQVHFLPPISYSHVPEAVLAHDVALGFVPAEPADWQCHPTLKVLEYRALGIPIIATDFLPNRDEVENDINGLLVENNIEAWAAAQARFIADPDFLHDCTANARHMRKGLSWDEVATRYARRLYLPLLKK